MKYIIHVIHRCLELINRRVQPHTQTMQRRLHGSVYFQHNFGTFQFRRKWMHRSVFVRVHNTIMTKRKILQSPQILFSCPNFADCFVGLLVKIRGKIDLNVNCENVVTWAQGSGWFWVMHSCRSIKGFFFIVCLTLVIQLLIATFQNRTEQDYSWPVCVHRARAQCANTICQARMVRTLRVLSRVFEEQKLPPRPSPPPSKRKMPSFPQKNIVIITVYKLLYRKIIKTRRGQCTHWRISQNCVSKFTRLQLSAYSFQNISRGMPPDPSRKLAAFGHSGLLPQTINLTQTLTLVSTSC